MAEPRAVCHPRRKLIAAGKCLECVREWWASRKPSERYQATVDECMEMLELQGFVCPICLIPFLRGVPQIDHRHFPPRPRGILCQQCNTAIGSLLDSPEILERAAEYLRLPTYEQLPGTKPE